MYARIDRLKELFLHEISGILPTLQDPGLSGILTVTGLDLSKDQKSAKVFYSVLGTAMDKAGTDAALERCIPFIRRALYSRLDLKFIPRLSFLYDDTPERAHRIENILRRLDPAAQASPTPEAAEESLGRAASKGSPPKKKRRR